MTEFTLSTTVPRGYDRTVARVRELLADAGFGVLTEIDLRATMKAKLDVEIPPQVILGACRPELAHRAITADPRLAVMLPCNVVVAAQETGTRVDVFDPLVMTGFSDSPALVGVATEARERLAAMMEALTHDTEDPDEARA
ncbi:DUF302 domain-containing protein [Aeromicrobium flavum]|uniref:DUF302 domain-containing protein n=1 Tax=Aeromicrobium flavum TaxID=416568 RepID=UPI0031E39B7F